MVPLGRDREGQRRANVQLCQATLEYGEIWVSCVLYVARTIWFRESLPALVSYNTDKTKMLVVDFLAYNTVLLIMV